MSLDGWRRAETALLLAVAALIGAVAANLVAIIDVLHDFVSRPGCS